MGSDKSRLQAIFSLIALLLVGTIDIRAITALPWPKEIYLRNCESIELSTLFLELDISAPRVCVDKNMWNSERVMSSLNRFLHTSLGSIHPGKSRMSKGRWFKEGFVRRAEVYGQDERKKVP